MHNARFVNIVGNPNVGKSTLMKNTKPVIAFKKELVRQF